RISLKNASRPPNPPTTASRRRNHPVFVAQHATATCCRGCLEKWHDIAKERELNDAEKQHVVEIIKRWLSQSSSSQ
ncbi:MAG TPA: DUF4186 family protein, partial [Pyrinomonadaceae bacterium]